MAKIPEEQNQLSDVRVTRVGLCKSPAVPEATHVLMKSRDDSGDSSRDECPAYAISENASIAKSIEELMSGITGLIRKALSGKAAAVEKTETQQETEMDISKATAESIEKANPALYAAIVAKALESLKEKDGKRVGDGAGTTAIDEKDGKRVADVSVASVTDDATDKKLSTTKEPLAAQPTGGFDPDIKELSKTVAELQKGLGICTTTLKAMCDKVEKFDTSRPGEKAIDAEEKKAVKDMQAATDHADESNGGVAKIDTSRPGEAAIATKEKAAVKATAAAVDASAKAGDSGIGAIEAGTGDTEADKARKDELGTLKDQVTALTKSAGDVADLQKAVALLIKKSAEASTAAEPVAKTEPVAEVKKARSTQAGQLDEAGAKGASAVHKSVFTSAISTIALAKSGREGR
jgi:uncharacterized coiled-coil protein SlyX